MTPFSLELKQTFEDLIPVFVWLVLAISLLWGISLRAKLALCRDTIADQQLKIGRLIQLQDDDLIKVKNAYKNESAAMIKYNALIRDHHKLNITADNLLNQKFKLEKEIRDLKDKLTRKSQPRDKNGHFISKAVPKTNSNIGKYKLIHDFGVFSSTFTVGNLYRRYHANGIDVGALVLIGDDRTRHDVTHIKDHFQLITE